MNDLLFRNLSCLFSIYNFEELSQFIYLLYIYIYISMSEKYKLVQYHLSIIIHYHQKLLLKLTRGFDKPEISPKTILLCQYIKEVEKSLFSILHKYITFFNIYIILKKYILSLTISFTFFVILNIVHIKLIACIHAKKRHVQRCGSGNIKLEEEKQNKRVEKSLLCCKNHQQRLVRYSRVNINIRTCIFSSCLSGKKSAMLVISN